MVMLLFQYTKDFPREYKFPLGQDMKRDGLTLVRSIYRASRAKEKEQYLEQCLVQNTYAIRGCFTDSNYWSSCENNANNAWNQNFNAGTQGIVNRYYDFRVRPVRAF